MLAEFLNGGISISTYPRILIDLDKITHNTKTVVHLAKTVGATVTGVTKATCGDPHVAQAMLDGGATSIADSRITNIKKMKEAGIDAEFMLLRTPMISELEAVIEYADISLQSERTVVQQLSAIAKDKGTIHKIILMIEMGDLREGATREELDTLLTKTMQYEGIQLHGLGMNLACFGGVVPTKEKIEEFERLVDRLCQKHGLSPPIISGGNSANIPSLLDGVPYHIINHLRIGEGILLGLETVNRTPIPHTFQDAFVLESEIIELKEKPSVPEGVVSQNAFGKTPRFKDLGRIVRGIVAVGNQDVIVEDLTPKDGSVNILGSSSDHIILHLKESSKYKVGDVVQFTMNYGALVHLFTSGYVKKIYHNA